MMSGEDGETTSLKHATRKAASLEKMIDIFQLESFGFGKEEEYNGNLAQVSTMCSKACEDPR